MNKPPLNLPIGYKINRWTIIGEPVSRNGRKHYPCRCDCGREELKRADNLKSGHSIGHRGCPLANTPIDESVKIEKQWKYKAENKTEIFWDLILLLLLQNEINMVIFIIIVLIMMAI